MSNTVVVDHTITVTSKRARGDTMFAWSCPCGAQTTVVNGARVSDLYFDREAAVLAGERHLADEGIYTMTGKTRACSRCGDRFELTTVDTAADTLCAECGE